MRKKGFKVLTLALSILVLGIFATVGVSAAIKEIPLKLGVNMTTNVKAKVYLQVDDGVQNNSYESYTLIFDNSPSNRDTSADHLLSGNTINLTNLQTYTSSTVFKLKVYNFSSDLILTPTISCDTAQSDEGVTVESVQYYIDNNPAQNNPAQIPVYSQQNGEKFAEITFRIQSLFQNKQAFITLNLEGNTP